MNRFVSQLDQRTPSRLRADLEKVEVVACIVPPPSYIWRKPRGGSMLTKQSQELRASASNDCDNKSRSIVNPRGSALSVEEQMISDDESPLEVDQENELDEEQLKQMRAVSSYPCTDEQIKENVCTKPICLANGKPHRHNTKDCKEHPYCTVDPIQERLAIHTTLPEPLPIRSGKHMKEFLNEVQNKDFGKSGIQTPGTQTVVTQYSLDHYWAQQWNLNIDQFPASLPDQFKSVQDIFSNYSRRLVGQTKIKNKGKITFAKKLQQWSQAETDRQQRDLEFLYWKSNQDPRIYAKLEKTYKDAESKEQKIKVKAVPIGKYTSPKHFKLETEKDMIPIIYPTSMNVTPVIYQLDKEHRELMMRQKENPGARFADITKNYYKQQKDEKAEEFNKMLLGQRIAAGTQNSEVSDQVRKLMESEHLNQHMTQSEIQEIAERKEQFEEMLRERKLKMIEANEDNNDYKQSGNHLNEKATNKLKLKAQFSRTQRFAANQTQQLTTKDQMRGFNKKLSGQASNRSKRPQSTAATKNSINQQTRVPSTTRNSQNTSRPRLFSNSKTTTNKQKNNFMFDTIQCGTNTELMSQQNQSSQMQRQRSFVSAGNRVNNFSSIQSATRNDGAKPRQLKTFTITVTANHRRSKGGSQIQQQLHDLSDFQSLSNISKIGHPDTNPIQLEEPSLQSMDQQRSKVFTDLIQADQKGKGHIQKQFHQAKWQQEKDQLVNTMDYHLTKHRPVIQRTDRVNVRLNELASYQKKDEQQLQQNLSKTFGVHGLSKVDLPEECKTFLSEVPIILQDKQKQDSKVKQIEGVKKDTCQQDTLKQRKDLKTSPKNSEQFSGELKVQEISKQQQDKQETQIAPRDPKPDIQQIAKDRLIQVKENYIDRVLKNTKVYKAQQATLDDPFADKGSPAASPTARDSQTQQTFQKNQRSNIYQDFYSMRCREAVSPGIGGLATGQKLRVIINDILLGLDDEIQEQPFKVQVDMELSMPEIEWDKIKLHSHIKDMDGVEFWQQKGIQCQKKGEVDAAMDYFRQGLRKNPNNHVLIYSLAVCYCQLKRYQSAIHWFSRGIDLHPRWIDGLCGIAVTYFNMLRFDKALKYITLAKDNSKGSAALLSKAGLDYDTILFIYATCNKMTNNRCVASNYYTNLEITFNRNIRKDIISLLWGLVLIPLSNDRKLIGDHYTYLREYLTHLSDAPVPPMENQNLLLSKLCKGVQFNHENYNTARIKCFNYEDHSPKLDFDTYSKSINVLIRNKKFFKRFSLLTKKEDIAVFDNVLKTAEIELYNKDMVVFLKGRIGIVTCGSVEIRRHNNQDLLKPYIVKKAVEGDIIGWVDGDCAYSGSPLSWLVAMQKDTEVLFLDIKNFLSLWNIQRQFTEQQIVLQKLNQNHYFKKLNQVTKYHLVYESLEIKIYYPGQLIMSVHQRSPLCDEFKEFYKDSVSKFRRKIDNKIMKQNQDTTAPSQYSAFLDVLNENQPKSYSENQKRKSMKIKDLAFKKSMVINRKSEHNTIVEEDLDDTNLSEDEPNNHSNQDILDERISTEFKSYDSNSTDYGVQHGQNIIQKKTGEATDAVKKAIQNTMNSLIKFDVKKTQQTKEQEVNLFSINKDIVNAGHDTRSSSEPPSMKVINKRKQLRSLQSSDILELSAHRLPKQKDKQVTQSSIADICKVLKFETELRGKTQVYMRAATRIIQEESDTESPMNKNLIPPPTVIRRVSNFEDFVKNKSLIAAPKKQQPEVNYKFLMQKHLAKIQNKQKDVMAEHKRRKNEMNSILRITEQVTNVIKANNNNSTNKLALKTMISEQFSECSPSPLQINKRGPTEKRLSKNETSGLNNQLLVNKVQSAVDNLSVLVKDIDSGDNVLYQILVSTMLKNHQQQYQIRQEPEGIHFIDSGEVLVVGKNHIPHARLSKCDAFGMCDVLKKSGPEFLGDVRSGVRQVHTFFFTYEEFSQRLSIPEKIKLLSDDQYQSRFDGIISFVSQRDQIDGDKLRRY